MVFPSAVASAVQALLRAALLSVLGVLSGGVSASGSAISSVGMEKIWNIAYLYATDIALLLDLSALSMPSPITVALTLLPSSAYRV